MKEQRIKVVGNVIGGGKAQGGKVYLTEGICPTLISGMTHGTTIPYLVVENKDEQAEDV